MSMSTDLALARLPDESWGQRLRRARGKRSLEGTAELVSMVNPTSHTSLARLEQLEAVPVKGKQPKLRARAVLALLVYGYNLEDFGLSLDDLPRFVDVQRFAELLSQPSTIDSPPSGVVSFRMPVLAGV